MSCPSLGLSSSVPKALRFAGASIKVAEILAQLPHIKVVAPVNIQITSSLDNIYGIDFKTYDALLPFVFLSGGPFQGPNDVIVDDYIGAGKKVGDTLEILKHPFLISTTFDHSKPHRTFIPSHPMVTIPATAP